VNVEILVVSYLKDKPWLVHCLNSIRKFARGFGPTTLLVPAKEVGSFVELTRDFATTEFHLMTYPRVKSSRLWHLDHQRMKCRSDEVCPNADFVLHTDSDCVFTEPVTPEDYFVGANPVMWMESYERLGNAVPWQPVVERALGCTVTHEFMRHHPQVNPRGVYADVRNHIESVHHMPFDQYVLSQKADFPWGFEEFDTIGAFAYHSPKWRGKYHWIDLGEMPRPKEKLVQMWSHGSMDDPRTIINNVDTRTPNQLFKELGV
jgi:hypothetical protein